MTNILYAMNAPLYKGGTEAVVLSYYDNIDKSKYHIDFLVHGFEEDCSENSIHKYIISNGSKIYYVTPRGVSYFRNIKDIREVLNKTNYDIVHSHMDAAGYFLLKEAKKARVPLCISHSHSTKTDIHKKGLFNRVALPAILKYAKLKITDVTDINLACSNESGKWLFGKSDFTILRNAIDTDKYHYCQSKREKIRSELGIPNNVKIIGQVARLSKEKNHYFTLELFSEMCKRRKDAKLILVGSGALHDDIVQKINKLGLDNSVMLLGVRADVHDLLQAFDVFILPSFNEGLPISAIEAQAAGLPCVMSDAISSEVVLSENVKLLSLAAPISYWCDCIDSLFNYNIDREKGAPIVRQAGYDIHNVIMKLEDIYEKGLSEKEKN